MTDFQVPSPTGAVTMTVSPGRPLFIVGRNGTGKSALIHHIQQQGGGRVIYLPGSRTSIFDGEGLNLTPSGRKQLGPNLTGWDQSPDVRWRNLTGNSRNEKAIHDLTAAEVQYISDLSKAISERRDVEASINELQAKQSPLDKVNFLLEQANIPVRMTLVDGELKARAGANVYSFARMSDGERIALILIAEVISAKENSVFVIDEPELHLHRSIVVPLIASLIKARPNCEFVVSTHELDLPPSIVDSIVCIVRPIKWRADHAVESWDIDLINASEALPEDLKTDILGSRRRVLFTEGTDESLDVPIYSILFPQASVRPKGSCREVQRAVAGITSTFLLHHTDGYGLIDNDGIQAQQITEWQAEHVYALPVFSVEALYYDEDVVKSVAERQAATLTAKGDDQQATVVRCLTDVETGVMAAASAAGTAEHLAGRVAERQVRDSLIAQMPKRDDLIATTSSLIQLSIQSSYPAELSRLRRLIATKDVFGLIARYPVRHSGILTAVARALKFQNKADYEAAALTRISSDEPLRRKLLAKLAPLSAVLNA